MWSSSSKCTFRKEAQLTHKFKPCREAVQTAATWDMVQIHFEADSEIMVRALQCIEYDRSPRMFLRLDFNFVTFSYAPRICKQGCLSPCGLIVMQQKSEPRKKN